MKRQKRFFLSLVIGVVALLAARRRYLAVREEVRYQQAIRAIRGYFTQMGEIAMVYVDQTVSTLTCITGGVGMADGRLFLFDYEAGELVYEETR